MNKLSIPITLLAMGISPALADIPTLGGPMSHLLITLFNQQIFVTYESPSLDTVLMQDNAGDFVGGAGVLNNLGYNAQFGWLANGFITLPPESGIFMQTLSMSDHLSVFDQSTFAPIMGTDSSSSLWQWDGTMTHNWYATDIHGGTLNARYEIFVGDLSGNPLDGYTPGFINLSFEYGPNLSGRLGSLSTPPIGAGQPTPTPGSLGILALGVRCATKRKRSPLPTG